MRMCGMCLRPILVVSGRTVKDVCLHMKAYPHGTCPPPHGTLSSSSGATLTALHAVRTCCNRQLVFPENTCSIDNSMMLLLLLLLYYYRHLTAQYQ